MLNKISSVLAIFSIAIFFQAFTSNNVFAACEEPFSKQLISTNSTGLETNGFGDCETNTPPPTPVWIQTPATSDNGTFTVTWAASFGGNYYQLEQNDGLSTNYVQVLSQNQLSFTTNELSDGIYTYRVKACSFLGGCSLPRISSSTTVNRPTPPPPSGGGDSSRDLISDAVGAISGDFRVDESGQATYSIPVYTPTGVANIRPNVSLNYNSGAGNGVMGVGWQLSVTDGISRCGQTEAINGRLGAINFDADDRYCLAGQQLVAVSGVYGASGTEYRTPVDNQTKIISYGSEGSGPSYFKVWRKDGSINSYGSTNNSQFHINLDGVVQSDILTWAHTYSEDRYGNRISYYYELDESNGENRIDSVEYSPNVKIQFNFDTNRPDYKYGYYLGSKTQLKDRLSSIVVTDNNIEVRRYDLGYETSASQASRLKTLTESKDGVSLQPTTFDWSDASKGIQADTNEVNDGIKFNTGTFINIDGDLEPDWLHINASGSNNSTAHINRFSGEEYTKICEGTLPIDVHSKKTFKVFDINGDGTDEAILATPNSIYAVLFNGNGCLGSTLSLGGVIKLADIDIDDKKDWFFGDINGDALPDLVYLRGGTLRIKYNLGSTTGTNFFGTEINADFITTSFTGGTNGVRANYPDFSDFNGDGKIDMFVKVENTKYFFNSSCFCYWPVRSSKWLIMVAEENGVFREYGDAGDLGEDVEENKDVQLVDLNSDGISDLVYRNKSDDRWHYKIFTGNKFLPSRTLYVDNDHPIYFGDHDRDGLKEVYYIESSKLRYREFNRSGTLSYSSYYTGVGAEKAQHFAQIDLNGDGELDIVSVVEDAHTFYTHYEQHISHNKTPFVARDRIVTINNGLNHETDITYKSLTDPSQPNLYDDDNGSHSGWQIEADGSTTFNHKGPRYVVQKVVSSSPSFDNVNNQNGIEYRYGRARSNSRYGSLGFEWLETIDLQTSIITRTVYKQVYPHIGAPEKTSVWFGSRTSARLMSEATTEFGSKVNGSYEKWNEDTGQYEDADIIYPYVSRVKEDSYDFNVNSLTTEELMSRIITTSDYDNHGNPTEQNVYTCYGHNPNCETSGWFKRMRTVNAYAPANESSWILGRLERAQVTHYATGKPAITRTSGFEYNATTGILTAEIVEPDQTTNVRNYIKKKYFHDAYGNIIRTTTCYSGASCDVVPTSDPFELYQVHRTTAVEYDLDGRYVTKTKNGYGQTTSEILLRNELGQAIEVKDIVGNISKVTYGTFGGDYYTEAATGSWSKQTKRICEGGISCPTGSNVRVEQTSADGSHSFAYLDLLGRTIQSSKQSFSGERILSDTAYDNKGRVWYTTLPYFENSSIYKSYVYYDELNRAIRMVHPHIGDNLANEDLTYYDGYIPSELAIKTRTVNALGQTKTEYKNVAGETVKVLDNRSKALTYQYNAVGDLLEVRNNGALQSIIQYDALGRKTHMWDFDKGAQNSNKHWLYSYNSLGELVYQSDPKNQQIRIYRDRAGRKIRQLDRNASGVYVADFRWLYNNSMAQSNAIGQLTKQYDAIDSDLVMEYDYDGFGRNDVTTTIIAGKAFVTDTVFDAIGRVYESYDSSGSDNGLRYEYNANGFLTKIKETKSGVNVTYREIVGMDAFGNVVEERFGNGVLTTRNYNPRSGRLNRIHTTSGTALRQNLEYEWDRLGRLKRRESISKSLVENFGYDDLNRIKTVNGSNKVNYDDKGNITWKHDVGSYSYGGTCSGVVAGHHAVSSAGGKSYCYDLNGNMTSGDSRLTTYSIFDKATKIEKGGHKTEFAYGVSRSRYKRVDTNSSGTTTTFYLGGVEYIQKPSGETFYRRSIPGAVIEVPATGSMKVNYLHTDHLGSTDVITNSVGNTAQEYSFDIFGQKRYSTNWSLPDSTNRFGPLSLTSKAYTGHESADEVGVIHMNGRIYDAKLGRFMQADPFVDGAKDTQGFNRYTYVRNNPLAYTDPTGFKRSGGLKFFQNVARAAIKIISFGDRGLEETATAIVSIAAGAVCGPCAAGVTVVSSLANGGNVTQAAEAGARSYIASYIATEIGGKHWYTSGLAGGIGSVIQGGKFGHGFLSAALGYQGDDVIIGALIGGLVSEATGGKFANGAVTGAFAVVVRNANSTNEDIVSQIQAELDNDVELQAAMAEALENSVRVVDNFDINLANRNNGHPTREMAPITGDGVLTAGFLVSAAWTGGGSAVVAELLGFSPRTLLKKTTKSEITKSSRKRVKGLIKKLSDNRRQNKGLSQEKTERLRRIVEKAGGKVRNDGATGIKGSSAGKSHVQTEGLGKSVDSRHIWTEEGVQ